ncbi:hypothetical protein VC83_06481 [Pseudogymnoascus destructans]|uniref:RraA-like protein n=1 Tax=Pseudogymnoascus destructans TaxID=655981 RepID=A0A177A7Y0_9PEZI|nr:uncharacterized protein VC83_06481 [Pseudogymnoascus destructans]OAF58246.1 hypothetical protein VC83_06481 [Pseudogymnoascus destructans]
MSTPATPATLAALSAYSACDISDALLALRLPHGGFIPDLSPISPPPSTPSPAPPSNIPAGTHWTDLVPTDTILIQSGPPSHAAMLGGILAMRLKYRGVRAVIAHGRVRDVGEIRGVELPVWSLGTSTVGSGGGVKAHAVDVVVEVGGVSVKAGDVVVADPGNGVVVIPAEKVGEVLALLPGLAVADGRI